MSSEKFYTKGMTTLAVKYKVPFFKIVSNLFLHRNKEAYMFLIPEK